MKIRRKRTDKRKREETLAAKEEIKRQRKAEQTAKEEALAAAKLHNALKG